MNTLFLILGPILLVGLILVALGLLLLYDLSIKECAICDTPRPIWARLRDAVGPCRACAALRRQARRQGLRPTWETAVRAGRKRGLRGAALRDQVEGELAVAASEAAERKWRHVA